jgi:hypothetical protein
MTTKTFHGSCHCRAVRFTCDIDLAAGTSKCNCSICAKGRFWKAVVKADALRITQGESALADYQFDGGTGAGIHHRFCRICGIKTFGRGHMEGFGDFYGVNLACLDDVLPEELVEAPMQYQDGRNNRWDEMPAETRHL